MQQHGNKYFTSRPPPLGSKFNFSEYRHAAYQIEWKHKCSNMVANIQLYQNIVKLHIKLKGMMHAATW